MKITITLIHHALTKTVEIEGSPDEVAFALDVLGHAAETAYEDEEAATTH